MVSPRAERGGANDQAGDERDIGAAGGSDGGSACGGKKSRPSGRAIDRSDAVQHGAFRLAGFEGAPDGQGRVQAEFSVAPDAQGSGAAAGSGESVGSGAASD